MYSLLKCHCQHFWAIVSKEIIIKRPNSTLAAYTKMLIGSEFFKI